MQKKYKDWNAIKSIINNKSSHPRGYKEREIWHASVGENIGFEEDGKGKEFARPVIILKIFNKKFCQIIPLSKIIKNGRFYHIFDGNTGKVSVALLSQLRAIDSSRLLRKIGIATKEDFLEIKNKVKAILSL